MILTDAVAIAVLSLVLVFFCVSGLVQLLNARVFTLDWYRPLILTFGIMFDFSVLLSAIALVRHLTLSAAATLAASLFFALALLANARIQVVLIGGWLLVNFFACALAYRRRATSRTSQSSRLIVPSYTILSIAFLPAVLVQGKIISPGTLLEGKLISAIALTAGVLIGLFLVVLFVIKMPSSVEVS